ncbi:MAG: MarR family EPS-associated transcriptional regulator [Chlorobi bacterium]|nr:MarR family EPS-associated transcriptional regulator [Chlorobiota bacterium]
MLDQEIRYKIFKIIQENPKITQRILAKELGVSLGKVNYCVKALIGKGLVKSKSFRNSQNKIAYIYLLTPKGIEEKSKVTIKFLKIRMGEFEDIKKEIEHLRVEISNLDNLTKVEN